VVSPWQKFNQYASFSNPEDSSHGLLGWGLCFLASFSLAILCDAIPCSELCFWIKVMPTAFIIHQDVVKKAVTFDSMCSSNYKKTFFTEVCASLSTIQETMGKDFPVPQTFHYLVDGMVPHSSLRYVSVIVTCHFSWMNPLIFLCSLSTGNSQATITGWSAMFCVPIFKILYPSSDTTPKNASPFACWRQAWTHDTGISSLIRNSITAFYQITCPFQLFSCTEILPHKGDVIFILVWEDR